MPAAICPAASPSVVNLAAASLPAAWRLVPTLGLALAVAALAAPAPAQESRVEADLDGDGLPESYALVEGSVFADLVVMEEGGASRVVPGIAWTGGMAGQRPFLELAPPGSLRVVSGNDAVGRDRWRMTVTVAHRDGDLRVAGVTLGTRDTLDPAAWSLCDLNLLTGRGERADEAGTVPVPAPTPAPPLWGWTADAGWAAAAACG